MQFLSPHKWLGLAAGFAAFMALADGELVNREYQLKAVYLFHFAELAEWPKLPKPPEMLEIQELPEMPPPFSICLNGSSPLRAYLPALEGQRIGGQTVHVRLDGDMVADNCRLMFFSDTAALTAKALAQAAAQHVLLVSDAEEFAERGGMIQFTLQDNKLHLKVNLTAVRNAGLRLSSKLLRMAEILE